MRGIALLLLAVSWAATAQTPIGARTILVVGDSISAAYGIQREQGWVALLEARVAKLATPHQVVNASISGDTTGGALARLPRALEIHKPDVVVIEVGGNDALRGYPINRIEHNLDAMVTLAKDAGADVLLLGMEIPPNYGARYTQAFRNVFSEVAARADAPLVPFLLDGVATDAKLMQADGIHPTAAAQPRLLENVWPTLKSLL
ncbi:MAG TPA: arylesterase [Pseudomonadales bacterium]